MTRPELTRVLAFDDEVMHEASAPLVVVGEQCRSPGRAEDVVGKHDADALRIADDRAGEGLDP
jgi:hypothetical protein